MRRRAPAHAVACDHHTRGDITHDITRQPILEHRRATHAAHASSHRMKHARNCEERATTTRDERSRALKRPLAGLDRHTRERIAIRRCNAVTSTTQSASARVARRRQRRRAPSIFGFQPISEVLRARSQRRVRAENVSNPALRSPRNDVLGTRASSPLGLPAGSSTPHGNRSLHHSPPPLRGWHRAPPGSDNTTCDVMANNTICDVMPGAAKVSHPWR